MYSTGSFDALGRVTGVQYPNSPQGVPGSSVDLQYDDFGRVTQISDETGATNLQYDVFSRITQIAGSGGRKTLTREYTPLPGAWRTRDTLSGISGSWDSYEDGKGRIYRSRNPFNQEVRREFDVAGALLKETLPNGTDTLTGYDAWGRLTSIEHRGKTGTGTALGRIEKYLYAYDSHDRVTEETIQSPSATTWSRYAYDSFGRMVRESTGQGQTTDNEIQYTYDRNDNRTQQKQHGVIEYSGFDAADRLLWTNTHSNTPPNGSGWSWRQFAYDDFGQMVYRARGGFIPNAGPWKREVDLKWDSQGRLREARDRSAGNRQLLSATYTADGERITKSDPITGAHINSYGLHDTNRNTVYTPGVGFRAAGTDRFHHADRLGSTRALTDGAGRVDTVKSKVRYSAFGEAEIQGPDGEHPTERQFAGAWGYEREPSATGLGLDYLYQRYYDPAIGRFISADPIGLAGGLNLYGYCAGDPVNAVDPSGEIANFVVAGCSSMALGFVMTKLAGGEYTWKDAAWDFGAGAVGVGVSGKLSKALRLLKMKNNPSPKLFFRGGAWKPEYLKTGKIAWASDKAYSGAPRAIDGGAHRFRWPKLKQPWKILERKPATEVFEIPAEFASQYQPAYGLNPLSWWKGRLGQYTYQNPAATGKVAATQAWASAGSALGSFTVERAARHYGPASNQPNPDDPLWIVIRFGYDAAPNHHLLQVPRALLQ